MDEDFEIELLDEIEPAPSLPQLPVNFLSFGDIEPDDVKVYIHQNVYKKLEEYSLTDTHKELGSILLGDHYEDQGKNHVVISDYIEAKYTDASAATLTFTHETWEYVHKERNRRGADKKIIGWQHTHPNYGIFLSNYDMFIQENFFNLPFQIAYVIDPVQNKRGFFQWKGEKVEKLQGFYVYNDVDKPVKIELTNRPQEKKEKKKLRWMKILLALLCAAVVALGSLTFVFARKYQSQKKQTQMVTDQLTEKDAALLAQEQKTADLEQLILDATGEDGTVSATRLMDLAAESDSIPENLKQQLADLADQDGSFILYTVEPGDSLFSICEDQGIDYGTYLSLILGLNGIEDGNYIEAGQKLILPQVK